MRGELTSADAVDECLSGALGQSAIREMVDRPLRHGVADLLEDCLPQGQPVALRLVRAKFKPGRKLTAYYELSLGEDHPVKRHAAVSWSVAAPSRESAPPDESPATTTTASPPFSRLGASSDDGRLRLLVSPADPSMPQLSRLTDPAHLDVLCHAMTGGSLGAAGPIELTTVRYRPGQRHVLHVGSRGARQDFYVKTDKDCSGAAAVAVAGVFRVALQRGCPEARVSEPLGYSVEDSAALWRDAPGRPLRSLLRLRTTQRQRAVYVVGRALRVLHATPAGAGAPPWSAGVGGHDVEAEAVATLRTGEHISALSVEAGQQYAALVADVVDAFDLLPKAEVTLTHGDLKSDNLLVDGDRLRILDLDRSGWADPALDLGKFLADLHWWCSGSDADELSSAFRDGYGATGHSRWARADVLAALFRLKFAARRVGIQDVDWSHEVHRRVDGVARMLREPRMP